jgi:hypothetical protein
MKGISDVLHNLYCLSEWIKENAISGIVGGLRRACNRLVKEPLSSCLHGALFVVYFITLPVKKK